MIDEKYSTWRVSVSDNWDVLGPFPIHAREQHFLSPSFPLNLSEPIDFETTWSSAYADGGTVGWSKTASNNGNLAVTFPHIRWASLRATEGWAALQHHSVLRTTITVHPPDVNSVPITEPPRLLVSLSQGSFFTVMPYISDDEKGRQHFTPKWYTGNIYELAAALSQTVDFPVAPSASGPSTYDIFVSGDYEIRLFGDPAARQSEVPELLISLVVDVEVPIPTVVLEGSHHVVPDIVDGWIFGDALGIGLRSVDDWWTVKEVSLLPHLSETLDVQLLREMRLAPSQTRIIPLRATQKRPFSGSEIELHVTAVSNTSSLTIPVVLHVEHRAQWSPTDFLALKATYFFATSIPTAFLVIPPVHKNANRIRPPVLALHGAGVDIINMPFWAQALPRQRQSWVILAAGRTAWGLDWHGPSAQDAWASIDALHAILENRIAWHPWKTEKDTRVLIIGHSNGGQGTWYMASRYPDRIVGAIPAAGYIKSQAYVPLIQSRSAHYIDPSVRAVLETALTADDNDLFLSNLVDTPILAIHGGDDENVPVWHTRELISVLKTWRKDANVTYQEDLGQPHWYPSLFSAPSVQNFLDSLAVLEKDLTTESHGYSFTLTVAIPSESGSLHGFRIESLKTPGRLGRLNVQFKTEQVYIKTINVQSFSIPGGEDVPIPDVQTVLIDGQELQISRITGGSDIRLLKSGGRWQMTSEFSTMLPELPSGRLSSVLTSSGPISIVIPDRPASSTLSAATRIAHDLDLYHKLDASVQQASEASAHLGRGTLGKGNIIILGGTSNAFGKDILRQGRTAFSYANQELHLNGRAIDEESAALFLHPHPEDPAGLVLFMHSKTDSSLERAARLFPIRTGFAVPDWIIIGETTDTIGAGGVQGAGVWGHGWTWNEALSSF